MGFKAGMQCAVFWCATATGCGSLAWPGAEGVEKRHETRRTGSGFPGETRAAVGGSENRILCLFPCHRLPQTGICAPATLGTVESLL